ncbi:MAG TPA: methylmalonyl Co-A mutase-associated GTPase MeaB [Thermosynergistes sp.]|nr:methylmalonyl Co-A mutase-associated GTPase MeaB [Thermosynergistes sp.]HPU76688.1 methylmalonyl Co-A mutase-associated GTPase MeaB [Thermosynergistes sp.]HPZ75564.1 methylmalonyl Co-A mutase-associated GTPase MeaB [Thermosynergistes sp.]HQE20311.1 methylmalonyl Co-A mutase-associated GTPase MeaB [Thermosynergistes sp.]
MENTIKKALKGDPRAIARLISLVESESTFAHEIMKAIYPHTGKAHLIGVTGAPGAGKSTLVDKIISRYKELGKSVGIIAVDPSSPFSGGAILGDRLRMQQHALDPSVFIRSMGTRGSLGGLSRAAYEAALILDACGKDIVIIETAGVGQTEIDIVRIADTVILLLVPGMGDDVQIMKAGIMEIADIFVVNKADREGADKIVAEVNLMLDIAGERSWRPPVLKAIAESGQGVDDIIRAVEEHRLYLQKSEEGKKRRSSRIRHEVEEILRRDIARIVEKEWEERSSNDLIEALASRRSDPYTEAGRLLEDILGAAENSREVEGA